MSIATTGRSAAAPARLPTIRARLASVDWFDLDADRSDETNVRNTQRVTETMKSVLVTERLVVLAGLGTSLGLKKNASPGSTATRTSAGAPTMAALLSGVTSLPDYGAIAGMFPDSVGNVELLLSACQFKLALGADTVVERFLKAAEKVILKLCSFVDATTDLTGHEVFQRKIARRQTRLARTQIFTTNYDLAFEAAASRINFNVIDGFGLGAQRAFDGNAFDLDIVRRRSGDAITLEPNVLQLFKLHGSVDWDEAPQGVIRSDSPKVPVLIYPSQNKFQMSYRPPYLESMSRFQIALREPDVSLIVVGFGFNDAHIVAPIEAAIRSNVGLRIVVVNPSIEGNPSPTLARLENLVSAGDRRVMFLQASFDQFVGLIPDTSPQDEREIHDSRTSAAWRP